MMTPDCPSPEALAGLAQAPPEGKDVLIAHLAGCDLCRRQVALLVVAEDTALPPSRLSPPLRPARRPSAPPPWRRYAQTAAAAIVIGAVVWLALRRPAASPPPAAPSAPMAETREIETPASAPDAPPPALPPFEPAPVRSPKTAEPPSPPAPAPRPPAPTTTAFAVRRTPLVVQPLELRRRAGELELDGRPMAERARAAPSQILSTGSGASVEGPGGWRIHLAPGTELAVGWTQNDHRPALRLRKGQVLLEAGDAPGAFHLEAEGQHVRLDGLTGRLHLSRDGETLSVSPLTGAAMVDTEAGGQAGLAPGRRLDLAAAGDALLEEALAPDVAAFPSPAPAPAPEAPEPPRLDPRTLAADLGSASYRFVSRGRWIREGVWSPEKGLLSGIGELAGYRKLGDGIAHVLRNRSGTWADPGPLRGEEAAAADVLRIAQPPHLLLELALRNVRREAEVRPRPDGTVLLWDFEPARIRPEMDALIERAFADGRLDAPAAVQWETLGGRLQLSLSREGRVVQIEDRRRVQVRPSLAGRPRFWYLVESVTSLDEHGRASFHAPR